MDLQTHSSAIQHAYGLPGEVEIFIVLTVNQICNKVQLKSQWVVPLYGQKCNCCFWNAVNVCVLSKGRLKKGLVKRNTPFFFAVGVVSVTIQQQLVDLALAGQANLHFSSYVISRWCVVCVWFSSVKVTPASNGTEVTSAGKFICSLIWCSCAAHLQVDVSSTRFPGECLFGFSFDKTKCMRSCLQVRLQSLCGAAVSLFHDTVQ